MEDTMNLEDYIKDLAPDLQEKIRCKDCGFKFRVKM